MARIKYPKDFLNQTELFKTMKAKHDEDPANSPITPFLTQMGIDLDKDDTNTDKALENDTLYNKTYKKGEDYTQDRNNLFNPVLKNMKSELQFLKKLYVENTKELGQWGAQVDEERIVYPTDFLQLTQLFKDVHAKHHSFPAGSSPLALFLVQNEIDINADLVKTTKAEARHNKKEQAKRDAEKYSELRDKLFKPVMAHVRMIAQYLKGLYVGNPKELGNWSYTVDDSPRNPRTRTVTIVAGSTRTIIAIKLLSEVKNSGKTELLLHKGRTAGKEPVALPVAGKFTIRRGWGTLSVENENQRENGKISYKTTNIGAG